MGDLEFLKVEGLGNDFLLVDRRGLQAAALADELARLSAAAPRLCDRRTGVGGDGLLLVCDADERGEGRMIVINHDGSRPEMCGNGLRCVAWFLASGDGTLEVQTDAGLLACAVSERDGRGATVTVDMGPARPLGIQTPEAGGGRSFTGVSMGNPHAVTFVGADEDPQQLARELGPAVELDPTYPDRTNVEFCRVDGATALTLWVWERGCGITGACGTGACATAAAAVRAELAPADTVLEVRLPGGSLHIEVPSDPDADVRMTGPARRVFAGRVSL